MNEHDVFFCLNLNHFDIALEYVWTGTICMSVSVGGGKFWQKKQRWTEKVCLVEHKSFLSNKFITAYSSTRRLCQNIGNP